MSSKAAAASAAPLMPVESPVTGVNLALASLLVEAIKTRRKYISKSSSSPPKDDEKQSLLKNIENKATDATTAFLNELRNQVESSSASQRSKNSASAPTNCLKFLLEIISKESNSFHLRRAALVLIREILQRSSDARCYLASGETLLEIVSIVEGVQDAGEECDTTLSSGGRANETAISPAALFQQEAIELIHQLALQYGRLYPKFTVASRLLGDMSTSIHLQSQNIGAITGNRERSKNQRHNIHLIRKKRDEALERGTKACQSLEVMIARADYCFKVLLPRWGGFNKTDDQVKEDKNITSISTSEKPISDDVSFDLEDDDSIEWEEGDADLLSDDEEEGKILALGSDHDTSSHVDAVAQTLAVMERSGTLLDGKLSVEFGRDPPSEGTNEDETKANARRELEAIVKKFSSKRMQRLNQWIHALTYADGMVERAVVDPASSAASGNAGEAGPVSVVLLSEDKRTLRGPLLQQMMKLKGEIEGVLKSAEVLGVHFESNEGERGDVQATATAANSSNIAGAAKRKRQWLTGTFIQGHQTMKKRKQTKNAKVRVIYRRK